MDVFSLPIVEIAVSVIICWMLFSIFCSMIQETIVQVKGERGRFLKKYILKQLYDNPNGINWGSLMYTNSNIDLLSRAYNKPASQITPKIFSETLIETVAGSHIVQSFKTVKPFPQPYQNELLNNFAFATEVLLPSDVMSFLKSALEKARIKAGADEEKLYNVLVQEISDWYEQLCEMTSIWYKKATKLRLFLLGLVLSIAFNIDSIALFTYFKSNPEARAGMIEYYTQNEAYLEDLVKRYGDSVAVDPTENRKEKLDSLKTELTEFYKKHEALVKKYELPVGWDLTCGKDTITDTIRRKEPIVLNDTLRVKHIIRTNFIIREKDSVIAGDTLKVNDTIRIINDTIIKTRTPIKNKETVKPGPETPEKRNFFLMALGFIISALAASMGAPFWFNLLKKNNPIKK